MTGSVIPLGDGLTGKSVLTQLLINESLSDDERRKILSESRKSLNIEMEFVKGNVTTNEGEVVTSVQFYVFPGQRQKISDVAPTFDEILQIFEFMPAIQNVSVLLLVYDISRLESLKSLESWTQIALDKKWITDSTLTILISNKADLQIPNDQFVDQVRLGIANMYTENGQPMAGNNVKVLTTSGMTNVGIEELRKQIHEWIGTNGKYLS